MSFRCLPLGHRWRSTGFRAYRDVSFGRPGVPMTEVHLICARCRKGKTKDINGSWDGYELAVRWPAYPGFSAPGQQDGSDE